VPIDWSITLIVRGGIIRMGNHNDARKEMPRLRL
jgi:hypothetical protein